MNIEKNLTKLRMLLSDHLIKLDLFPAINSNSYTVFDQTDRIVLHNLKFLILKMKLYLELP